MAAELPGVLADHGAREHVHPLLHQPAPHLLLPPGLRDDVRLLLVEPQEVAGEGQAARGGRSGLRHLGHSRRVPLGLRLAVAGARDRREERHVPRVAFPLRVGPLLCRIWHGVCPQLPHEHGLAEVSRRVTLEYPMARQGRDQRRLRGRDVRLDAGDLLPQKIPVQRAPPVLVLGPAAGVHLRAERQRDAAQLPPGPPHAHGEDHPGDVPDAAPHLAHEQRQVAAGAHPGLPALQLLLRLRPVPLPLAPPVPPHRRAASDADSK
mmetsp:Transcript_4564/g.10741  ORF Transcript_4564/g.10741 Transcript_4564/m.10741 type:complete len:264 (-) Transcript_4564:19-810(-)